MNRQTNNGVRGIGICGVLGIAFVILKLCHVIEWHWAWVTAPFWGPVAIVLAILLTLAILKALLKLVNLVKDM